MLEEQLAVSCREVEGALPREGPSGENRHLGTALRALRGLVLMDDLAAAAEAAAAIIKMRDSITAVARFLK